MMKLARALDIFKNRDCQVEAYRVTVHVSAS
jgi:hypothetical protein